MVKGFQEVIFSVSNIEAAEDFYLRVANWECIFRGATSREQLNYWGLGLEAQAHEVVLKNPGDQSGYLRLIQFQNVPQVQIRSSGKPWDSGGIFDVNMRSKDLAATFQEFQQAGWNGHSDPVRFQFGKFDVSEVAMQGPDGIVIAMMQRHAPPLEGFPHLKKLSHIFNSTHIAKDIDAAYDFFINKLGFKVYLQVEGKNRAPGKNVLGLPQNTNAQVELPVFIVHPDGTNLGSIEFLKVKGLEGEDFSARAVPPNLGILMIRFPVEDAAEYLRLLKGRGVEPYIDIQELSISPYGKVKVFVLRSPDGVWLEFMEMGKE